MESGKGTQGNVIIFVIFDFLRWVVLHIYRDSLYYYLYFCVYLKYFII